MRTSTAIEQCIGSEVLYLAIELSRASWKLGFATELGQRVRERTVPAWDLGRFADELGRAKAHFDLAGSVEVRSCCESGRDGFSVHRFLEASGIENVTVDSASIEVKRHKKRAKTDRLDLAMLMNRLIRYHLGEPKVWAVSRVPTVAEEDQRQLHRELGALKVERTRHINRVKGLLATQGIQAQSKAGWLDDLDQMRCWDGSSLPPGLRSRIEREAARLALLQEQIQELQNLRSHKLRESEDEAVDKARRLLRLKGVGDNGSWLLVMEFFAWRDFRNRRQLGGLSGLTPTPFRSGDFLYEQGISKAGNRWVRAMMIELAWAWVRHQPHSELTQWFERRYGSGNSRSRRIGIVALARKLLIAYWRYLEEGIVPEGAELKAA
jgi:transposase